MSLVRLRGATLGYARHGTQGDPTVLVHGPWSDRQGFGPLVDPLARSLQLLVYDRRGYGESSGAEHGAAVGDDADDLAALLETLDFFPVHLVAHSSAAAIAVRLALDRPELVRSLVLHEPPFVGLLLGSPATEAEGAHLLAHLETIRELVRGHETQRAARRVVETFDLDPGAWERLTPDERHGLEVRAARWSGELTDPAVTRPDREALHDVWVPVLLTRGTFSPPFLGRILDVLAENLPNATLQQLTGVGYAPERDRPLEYVGQLLTFLLERNVPST